MIRDFYFYKDTILYRLTKRFCKIDFLSWKNIVQRYVVRHFKSLALEYDSMDIIEPTSYTNNTIWVFWAQGEESMPPLVKLCIKQIDKMRGNYHLIILDKDTYKDYVDIPDVILKKLAEGKISFTHFSDILRFALLMKYGGWWMDATIYPIHKIENIDTVYSVKSSSQTEYISECKWSSFLWYLPAGHPMAGFLFAAWIKYWCENDTLLTYLLTDHLIKLFYDINVNFRKEIDALPNENKYLYFFQSEESNQSFNDDKWVEIIESTKFFKCNWRNELKNERSSYKAILFGK